MVFIYKHADAASYISEFADNLAFCTKNAIISKTILLIIQKKNNNTKLYIRKYAYTDLFFIPFSMKSYHPFLGGW